MDAIRWTPSKTACSLAELEHLWGHLIPIKPKPHTVRLYHTQHSSSHKHPAGYGVMWSTRAHTHTRLHCVCKMQPTVVNSCTALEVWTWMVINVRNNCVCSYACKLHAALNRALYSDTCCCHCSNLQFPSPSKTGIIEVGIEDRTWEPKD